MRSGIRGIGGEGSAKQGCGVIYAASFLPLTQALLAWAFFGLASVALAAWLMSIEMPHERERAPTKTPARKKKL